MGKRGRALAAPRRRGTRRGHPAAAAGGRMIHALEHIDSLDNFAFAAVFLSAIAFYVGVVAGMVLLARGFARREEAFARATSEKILPDPLNERAVSATHSSEGESNA